MRVLSILLTLTTSFLFSGHLDAENFHNPLRIPATQDPVSVFTVDVNGDGVPDLLYETEGSATTPTTMAVLLGQSSGGYSAATTIPLPSAVGGCNPVDANRDGKIDLVCFHGIDEFDIEIATLPGNSVTLNATVAEPAGSSAGAPTGTVTFSDGATTLASPITLTAGVATYKATFSAAGFHTLTAWYSGDALHDANTASVNEQVLTSPPSGGATGEWTWMGGSSSDRINCDEFGECGQPGVYGTLGTPAAANFPGGRSGGSTWTDGSGTFWLFDGMGIDANGYGGLLNDVWKFNPATVQWTWMGGSSTIPGGCQFADYCGPLSVFGTLYVPAQGNTPGGRSDGAKWTDSQGHFWFLGGYGNDVNGDLGDLNDLWEFDPSTNQWAWMGGSKSNDQAGVYGTMGTAAAGNMPGSREQSVTWTDSNGHFWLFGGLGMDADDTQGYLNDLWEYDPSTKLWTWMGGSTTIGTNCGFEDNCGRPGVYGTLGTAAAGNIPGGRQAADAWTDSSGRLWLFGGFGFDSKGGWSALNDLWEFYPSTGQWAWMGGSDTIGSNGAGQPNVYGSLGVTAPGNSPGGHYTSATWVDGSGNLWFYGGWFIVPTGGQAVEDQWELNPSTLEWTWWGGGLGDAAGVYGTLGVAAAGDYPGGRSDAMTWTDSHGNPWLFGGGGYDANDAPGALNDLWTYLPGTGLPAAATPTFNPPAGSYSSPQTVAINDTTPGAVIYYTTDNSTPTTSSSRSSAAIPVSETETIKAIATATGYTNSAVATATYTITASLNATTTTLTATPQLDLGQTLTLTATVTAASGSVPTGTVSFLSGGKTLGSGSLNAAGVVTVLLTPNFGNYSITASYGGDPADSASVSTAESVVVVSPDIYTYAGDGVRGAIGDGGPATSAEIYAPWGIAVDAAGNLYIADGVNNDVRKVIAATGVIETIAGNLTQGSSGDGGPATSAELNGPIGIAVDSAGNLYIADSENNRIRRVDASTGVITTAAGTGTSGFGGDGGPATSAELNAPSGVVFDAAGNLYIADQGNQRIRKVAPTTGIITTIAGNGTPGFAGDGGPAIDAEFTFPISIAIDSSGNLFIADLDDSVVRKITAATGIITTVAGVPNPAGAAPDNGDGGPATSAVFNYLGGIAVDASDNIYITESEVEVVREVDAATGIVVQVAGNGDRGFAGDGGPAIDAEFREPDAAAIDSRGNLYIADNTNGRIRVVGAAPLAPLIPTTTTLTASATSLTVGQSLTLTATVTATSGATPTGTVTFLNGTTSLGTGTLNASGVATLTLTPAVGTYSVTASYGGSTTDAVSVSAPPITVAVIGASTTTSLVAAPTTMPFGQSVTLTATTTAASGQTPTGTITFLSGTTSLGTGTLNASGTATLTLGLPAAGVYSITASYPGSTTDGPSVSSPATIVTVTPAATTTTLTSSLNPAPFGAAVTFNANVAGSNATTGPTPSGSVSFYDGTTQLSTATLTGGLASYTTSELSVGSHNITAAYTATSNFASSTSSVLIQVINAATFTLSAAPASQTLYTGQAAVYTATVTPGIGFNLPVALSCSQLPANTTCTFSPATVNSTSWNSTLTIQTTAPGAPTSTTTSQNASSKLGAIGLAGLLLLFLPRPLRRYRKGWQLLLLAFASMAACIAITACSGPGPINGGTPTGSQTITITGIATNGSQSLTQTTTVTLNVQSLF